MKRATLTETKNNLSALVDQVQQGETILIVDRGRPVARLEPVCEEDDPEERLTRLERQGFLSRAAAQLPMEVLTTPPPRLSGGASILESLLAEREETILDLEGSVQPKNRPEDFGRIRRQVAGKRGRMRAKPGS